MTNRRKSRQDFNNRLPAGLGGKFRKELLSNLSDDTPKTEYLRGEILSKYLDPKVVSAEQRRSNAIAKWLDCEQTNMRTNERLLLNDEDFGWTTSERFLNDVRQQVCRILGLGELSRYTLHEMEALGVLKLVPFSNGASTRIKRGETAALKKLAGIAHITESAVPYWDFLTEGTVLEDHDLQIMDSSMMFTVDKKSDIDRVACKEPEVNMSLQRGIGEFIRSKLQKVGIDLRDQTQNQRLAKVAYAQGLATVDLSAASDSITRQLAFHCLPFSLWSICEDLRVESTLLPGSDEPVFLEMFSSMGNGFTFELESLLFYAITRVVARRSGIKGRISVYGDDIICHRKIVPRLTRLFAWLGFRVNQKKTNYVGPFRESCGKHYHRGHDITPFYIRREVTTMTDLIRHLNHLLAWDSRLPNGENVPFFTTEKHAVFHAKWSKFVPSFLYGGYDTDQSNALVTGDRPRKKLVPITRDVPYAYAPAMKHWFMMAEHQQLESKNYRQTPPRGSAVGKFVAQLSFADIPRPIRVKLLRQGEHTMGRGPMEITPKKDVGFKVRYNRLPSWELQCAWDPQLLFEDHSVGRLP